MELQTFISWNLRGANSASSKHLVRNLVLSLKPSILCLQETKCGSWSDRSISSLGFSANPGWIETPSQGQSGGLLTVWEEKFLSLCSFKTASNWILIRGVCKLDNRCLVIINVYAPQISDHKQEVWAAIQDEIASAQVPYVLLMGDFNSVRKKSERLNTAFNKVDSLRFNNFIENSGLYEVYIRNSTYTWFGPAQKCSQLDRVLISQEMLALGNWSTLAHDRYTSDHKPLSLSTASEDWGPKPYKFFNYLLQEKELVETLRHTWGEGRSANLVSKFRAIRGAARSWAASHFGNLDDRLQQLAKQQSELDEGNGVGLNRIGIKEEMDKLLHIKVSILCQKSRQNWELNAERNTRFFNRALIRRQHSNKISSIVLNGTALFTPSEIKKVFHSYFEHILQEPSSLKVFHLSADLLLHLTKTQQQDLVKEFSMEEIFEALQATDGSKAPGPDGINAGVLRSLWPAIKEDVLQFFSDFHSTSFVPKGYNASFIALVPKIDNPTLPSHFRPISLMNSVMKLLSKVLARRLKYVMHFLVSPVQSAFIQGRQISDSIIVANEVIFALQKKKSRGMVLKIDFEKAFDKIRWEFVFEVLRNMGFDCKWVDWITSIFNSSTISVLVNGATTDEFTPSRGLRQGDPLSPLIFNLVGEVLSKLLDRALEHKIIEGVSLPNVHRPISHLQFADDVILFLSQDVNSIMGVKRVLQCFQIISGLKINFSKSSLYCFDKSAKEVEEWASFLGCEVGKGPLKYLGAVLGASPSSLAYWDPLLRKVQMKAKSIDPSTLSIAGRTVVLKSMIDSIPSYWFSLFKIPAAIVNKLERIRRHFLWGGKTCSDAKRVLHYLSWNRVCAPKEYGGLGLASLRQKNQALMARWVWRAYKERDKFWNNVVAQRYGRCWNYDINRVPSNQCSPIVKSIISAHLASPLAPFLGTNCFKWSLRNGERILFWEDCWQEDAPLLIKFPQIYSILPHKHLTVKEFINRWTSETLDFINKCALTSIQTELDRLAALIVRVRLKEGEDLIVWKFDTGIFSSKACSSIFSKYSGHENNGSNIWKHIWSIKAPPKIKAFLWRVQWKILPTKSFLHYRLCSIPDECPWCGTESETISHIFWGCELSIWAWDFISSWWNVKSLRIQCSGFSLANILNAKVIPPARRIWQLVVAAVLWSIWLARNELIFSNVRIKKGVLLALIRCRVSVWGKASGILGYGDTPVWKVNPQGAVALHLYKLSNAFWLHKRAGFDLVCAVDGAWGYSGNKTFGGGIGGTIRDKSGNLVLSFSGPVLAAAAVMAELRSVIYAIDCIVARKLSHLRSVICSDSILVVNAFNKGVLIDFPILHLEFRHQNLINKTIFVQYVPRYLNENADSLAKNGITKHYVKACWAIDL